MAVSARHARRNAALVERLRQRPLVIVSPHHDDACLSLAGVLSALGQGTLVNIFTRSVRLAKSVGDPGEESVRAIREAEDQAFARRCGLVRHDLGCYDPTIRATHSFDVSRLEEDVAQATQPLLDALAALAAPRAFLLAPLGAGRHVDHRATVEVVFRNFERLSAQYEILFYEDQPYAADLMQRMQALIRLKMRLKRPFLVRNVFVPDWREKAALIALYPSQFPDPVVPKNYRPFALGPFVPHEALWSLATL
jgi:LmbE family N-acetylglucosaminyl deacetylase